MMKRWERTANVLMPTAAGAFLGYMAFGSFWHAGLFGFLAFAIGGVGNQVGALGDMIDAVGKQNEALGNHIRRLTDQLDADEMIKRLGGD